MDYRQQHRRLSAELVSTDQQAAAFEQMGIPSVRRPMAELLPDQSTQLHTEWLAFDRELHAVEQAHLDYYAASTTLTRRRPNAADDDALDAFSNQLPSATWPIISVP